MSRPRTVAGCSIVTLTLIAVGQLFTTPGQAQDHGKAKPGQIFAARCASCHTVPDTRFATDKAWLGQILETA